MIAASRLCVIVFLLLLKCLPASASVYKECPGIGMKLIAPQVCSWNLYRDGNQISGITSWDGSKNLEVTFFLSEEVTIASNPRTLDERKFTISPTGLVKRDLIEGDRYFKNTNINGVFPQLRISFLSQSESFRLRVQENLQRLNLYRSKIDGTWGPKTYQALVAYNTIFNQTIFVKNKRYAEVLLRDIHYHQRFDYQDGLLKTRQPLSLQTSQVSEAAARYAATGIWQLAPDQSLPPDTQDTSAPYIAAADRELIIGNALALPNPSQLMPDAALAAQDSPAAHGIEFDLDERGLVRAVPGGALTPEGVPVFAGRPGVLPYNFPSRPATTPEAGVFSQALQPLAPIPNNIRAGSGCGRCRWSITLSELKLIRPRARPDFQAAKEKKLNLVESWTIYIGTYSTRYEAETNLSKTGLLGGDSLKNALRRVLKNSNGYAAFFQALSEVDAIQTCEYLKRRGVYCMPLANAFEIQPNTSKKLAESAISNLTEKSKRSPLGDRKQHKSRKALVIGNANYLDRTPLRNALNDARDVAKQLTKIGFKVTYRENLSYREFGQTLNAFKRDVENSDISLFYYAGHGVEVDKQNYFIPVDASLRTLDDVRYEAIMIDDVISASSNAKKLSIVLIDACRDNPFSSNLGAASRSLARGLSIVDIEPRPKSAGHNVSQIISFAASSGQVAQDGEGRNSPYAMALIELLDEPNLEIGKLFRLLGDRVSQLTDGVQQPVRRDNLRGEDIFLVVE